MFSVCLRVRKEGARNYSVIIMGTLLNCVASESEGEKFPRNNKMLFDFIISGEKGFLF